MVSFFTNLIVATLLGFLAGMGIGGGSLLLLWLTHINNLPQPQARIINLLFFLPAAAIATFFRSKHMRIEKKPAMVAAIAGCIAAVIFSYINKFIDVTLLRKLLGILLIFTGIREIFYRPRNAR